MLRPAHAALVVIATAIAVGTSSCGEARALETFTLEQYDHIVAEAPGCTASCRAAGTRRQCSVSGLDCRLVCKTLAECRPDGVAPIKACAIIRSRP